MKKHIAFSVLANHPHIGPTLPIVSVMTRRGYRVTYPTTQRFASRVHAVGADIHVNDLMAIYADTWREGNLNRWVADQLALLCKLYEADLPNLIIYDEWGFAGLIFATRYGIPAIYTGPSYALDRRYLEAQMPHSVLRELFLKRSATFDRLLGEFGVCNTDWYFNRGPGNIFLCPRIFQPLAEMMDESCFFAGRCAGEQPCYGYWTKPKNRDKPIALVATSTNVRQGPLYFKTWINAFEGLGLHVLLSIGDWADPSVLGRLPPNFEVVQHVSHVTILPYVSLYVGCGGIISSAEAAYHGVPMILTSVGNAEIEWEASILHRLGLAVHVMNDNLDSGSLRNIVRQVVGDEAMLSQVQRIRDLVRQEPGAENAVNRIEETFSW